MNNPKFQAGDRVFYPARQRTGVIETVINRQDPADLRAQGARYEVRLSDGWLWSVQEKHLRAK